MKITKTNGIWRLYVNGKVYPCLELSDVFTIIKIKYANWKTTRSSSKKA